MARLWYEGGEVCIAVEAAKGFGGEVANAFVIAFHGGEAAEGFGEDDRVSIDVDAAEGFGEGVEIEVEIFGLFA